jgi:hypothetical protein
MATIELARIGELKVPRLPTGLRWNGPTTKRLVRFVIQTDGPADVQQVRLLVSRALGLSGPLPRRRTGRLRVPLVGVPGRFPTSGAVHDHVDVHLMFPGADAADRTFKLADFIVLSLPMTHLALAPLERPDQAAVFEIAYQIKDRCNFIRVEPELFYKKWRVRASTPPAPPAPLPPPDTDPPVFVGFSSGGSSGVGESTPPPATADHAWNLRSINWPDSNNGGLGITVGQVDTGNREHDELIDVYTAGGLDVLTGSTDPTDPLSGPFPGHGVATAGVLASRGGMAAPAGGIGTTGPDPAVAANHEITGVANQAKVVPVRATDSVVIVSNIDVAEGVWHLVQQDVDVITISLGGYANQYLERVVSFAVFSDIVVVAAGGQYWPVVPAPALYRDCIAATGSTVDKKRWTSASIGLELDIAAPAEHVWVPDFDQNGQAIVKQSSGTSFASPTVAGVAALWLARRGKQFLLDRYAGQRKLAEVFRGIARSTAQNDGWDTLLAGAGIIDASAVLNAPLPLPTTVLGRDWSDYDVTSERRILRGMLGNPAESDLVSVLGKFFNTTDAEIDRRLDEFGAELLAIFVDSAEALESLQRAVQAEAEQRLEDAEDAIDEVVDGVVDLCSDAAATVMGWFD